MKKKSVELFEKMGLDCTELINKGRKLILPVGDYEAVLAKAADVITYVEQGVCDIGIVGKRHNSRKRQKAFMSFATSA